MLSNIDAFSHAKITQNRNRYVRVDRNGNDISLSDDEGSSICLKHSINAIYLKKQIPDLKKYNYEILLSYLPDKVE